MGMHTYQELKIWQRSMNLAEMVYMATETFPKDERFGLCSQLKRCCVSIPSNISEGAGRGTTNQFKMFLEYAMGSCNELQTQIQLASRFKYLSRQKAEEIQDESLQIFKMIFTFYKGLN